MIVSFSSVQEHTLTCFCEKGTDFIHKQDRTQFNPQIAWQVLNCRCIAPLAENLLQAGKGGIRIAIEYQWCDPMFLVISLARNTVGRTGASGQKPSPFAKVVRALTGTS